MEYSHSPSHDNSYALPNTNNISHPEGAQASEDLRQSKVPDKPLEVSGDDGSKGNRSTKSNAPTRKKKKSSNVEALKMKKSKKFVGSTSKTRTDEAPSKKRKRLALLSVRPPLPKGISYVIKQVPRHSLRFGVTCNCDFADDIKTSIGPQALAEFRQTIFGRYLRMLMCKFQGQIMKCVLLLEIEQDNSDEIHIRHGSGNVLRFSKRDFSIITGLKCTGSVEDFQYTNENPSRLMRAYFPGAYASVKKGRLIDSFMMGEWESNEDAVQMAILYFIHSFIYSQLPESPVPADYFRMVEDGSFVRFPWGQSAYDRLLESLDRNLQ